MSVLVLLQALRGPFNFLRPEPEEVRQLFPDAEKIFPSPQRVYLEDEAATPIQGFPVLISDETHRLRRALEEYVYAEEEIQLAIVRRASFDRKVHTAAWERYRELLAGAVENATMSSYGRHFPAIFWLFHSIALSRLLKETPRRLVRLDLQAGRAHGDEIKYRIFDRYLDRVLTLTYDQASRVAEDTEEMESDLFPALLNLMRDNVLILTEDHVSPDLGELSSYFAGHLRINGKDFRERLETMRAHHQAEIQRDPELRRVAEELLGTDAERGADDLLVRSRYLDYLDARRDPALEVLSAEHLRVWKSLLIKLKEFELLQALRRLIIPVREKDGRYLCPEGSGGTPLRGRSGLALSSTTRPLDFLSPWVVNPEVDRCGLLYDITEFSEVVSVLRRSSQDAQDLALRTIFRFQQRLNRLALHQRLKLEKYLGDGVFYSGREARPSLLVALQIQRYYRRALEEGFAFDRGLRIALNQSRYRLLPILGHAGGTERYEFFGHGIVELSRLVTGKATREIDEVRTLLVGLGYPPHAVDVFFAPVMQQNVDLVDKAEESRRFHAYLNPNGSLINEGIVATGAFIAQLDAEAAGGAFYRAREGDRDYVVVGLSDGDEIAHAGIRKLGMASFKGLERVAVYEIVDGAAWSPASLDPLPETSLLAAIERQFGHALSARGV